MRENPISQIRLATITVLSSRKYLIAFILLSFAMLAIYTYIPVNTIPGNDIRLQLSLFSPSNWGLMIILAVTTGLLFVMNFYVIRERWIARSAGNAGLGGGAGVMAAVFGTAACSSCVAAFFGFLGAPAVFFLLNARSYIVAGAIVLLVISIYFVSKNVNKVCESCEIPDKKTSKRKRHEK